MLALPHLRGMNQLTKMSGCGIGRVKCASPPSSQGYESTNQNEWVWYRESKFNYLSSPGGWA